MPTAADIGELAASAGLARIHILAWRDLEDPDSGGSEIHAARVARVWAEAGIKVTMRTSSARGAPASSRRDGYDVIRRGGRLTVFPRAAGAETAGLHGPRDALVEIWNGVPFLTPVWARGARATWIHYPHTELWQYAVPPRWAAAGRVFERDLALRAYRRTEVVTLAESSRRRLVDEFGLRSEHVHVVPPGVDERFRPLASQPRSAGPLLLAVGRLTPYKRFDRVIRAVHRLRAAHADHPLVSSTRLVIVGSGDARRSLESLIAALGAGSWCRLTGRVGRDALLKWYRQAWALVSASLSEGWGMTVTEAAACGTPAVVTDIDGHADSVLDGRTGHLVGGDEALQGALLRMTGDPEHRDRLGAAALARAADLRWERTAHGTLEVLARQRQPRRRRLRT